MRRSLLVLLLVIVTAGWVGTLVARDAGYVLISYDGATIQTGFWVLLGAIAVFIVGGYYLLKFSGALVKTPENYRRWQGDRKRRKSMQLTQKGLTFLQEGSFDRALKYLVSGANNSDSPGLNYIAAARAADQLGNGELREQNLRMARESDTGMSLAVQVAEAEMCAVRGEWQKCIASLEGTPNNATILALKKQALIELRSWQALSELMPTLRKSAGDQQAQKEFEKLVALKRLGATGNTNEGSAIIYKKLTDDLKNDPDVVLAFCEAVSDEREIELVLRGALKRRWHEQLAVKYGEATRETGARRLKIAEGWMKDHTDNYATHLCMAQLYEIEGNKEQAMSAYQRSLAIQETRVANERLAFLFAFEGDYKKSNELLRAALILV